MILPLLIIFSLRSSKTMKLCLINKFLYFTMHEEKRRRNFVCLLRGENNFLHHQFNEVDVRTFGHKTILQRRSGRNIFVDATRLRHNPLKT